jgi:ABC-type sugar transport system permease subunit
MYLSLFDADIYSRKFVGLSNYFDIFQSTLFLKSLANTFYYILLIVPATVCISLIFASLIQGLNKRSKSLYRLIFYLPVVSTPVVLSLVWSWMYNPSIGIVNYLASMIGIENVDVLQTQLSALVAISVIVITWMVGQPIILYLSAMDGVSQELYEAAEIDGASPIQ